MSSARSYEPTKPTPVVMLAVVRGARLFGRRLGDTMPGLVRSPAQPVERSSAGHEAAPRRFSFIMKLNMTSPALAPTDEVACAGFTEESRVIPVVA